MVTEQQLIRGINLALLGCCLVCLRFLSGIPAPCLEDSKRDRGLNLELFGDSPKSRVFLPSSEAATIPTTLISAHRRVAPSKYDCVDEIGFSAAV